MSLPKRRGDKFKCDSCGKHRVSELEKYEYYEFVAADEKFDGGEFSCSFERTTPFCECDDSNHEEA